MAPHAQLAVAQRCRVIVDNDWSGDPDGLVALAHHLLSPANRVVAVTSSFLHPMFGSPVSRASDGAALARELVALVGLAAPPVSAGSDGPFTPDGATSAAADAIVAEARRDDPLPLYLVCAGPLTNIAAALHSAPDIAPRLTLVWVGGALAPAEPEYNRDTDAEAAAFVLGSPHLEAVLFPVETYRRCTVSVAELEHDLGGSGVVGQWLWERFTSLPLPDFLPVPTTWALGDSPPLLVTALGEESSTFSTAAGHGPGARRICTQADVRLLAGDLLARLRLHERRRNATS
jgi:hypothetical protein